LETNAEFDNHRSSNQSIKSYQVIKIKEKILLFNQQNDRGVFMSDIENGVKVGPQRCGGLDIPNGFVGLPTPESGYVIVPLEEYKELKTAGILSKYDNGRGK
jgi:hypothetical protein